MPRRCYFGIERQRADSRVINSKGNYLQQGSFATETKVLKQLVRDHIDPNRDLGHSDKHGKKKGVSTETESHGPSESQESTEKPSEVKRNPDGTICEDCK